ncbi:auxin efflux carrier [Lentinula aciculospora]|uniref:Auxin efflux carrier n=1 Tax=Lentinula aciculospora TaxID=153920 RepID=A0A9W9A674_9AGAR|nr:auxin efflux carrier [Lentinula aciculospora]
MNSAGFLIYEGVMPLLKTYIAIFIGYTVARTGLFPPAASRSSSQLTMNVALPCLIFSNIVPAFTPSNISAIGPLMLLAVIYILVGFVSGLIIREVCFVPRNFWQGIIICTGMSNWGNLPTSVVQSVTAHAPFDGTTDVELGVSFVSIFIMVYHIFFWVFGAAASLQWDFLPDVPQGEEAMRPVKWNEKPIGGLVYRWCCQQPQEGRGRKTPELIENTKGLVVNKEKEGLNKRVSLGEKNGEENSSCPELLLEAGIARMQQQEESVDPDVQLARRVSRISAAAVPSRLPPLQCDSTSTPHPHSHNSSETTLPLARTLDNTKITSKWEHFFPAWFARTIKSMSVIITPVTIALAISLPVSVIQPLKALFTDATASGGPDWIGPDGSPPLNFIMDTATFIGALCVPLSLIILGASFARMSIPKRLSTLPIPAMILVTLSKEVMVPVIGIFLTQTFVAKGLIPKESLAQRFVAIFLSGTPTAVNQLVVATLYAPEGGMDTLTVSDYYIVTNRLRNTYRSLFFLHKGVPSSAIHIHVYLVNSLDCNRLTTALKTHSNRFFQILLRFIKLCDGLL